MYTRVKLKYFIITQWMGRSPLNPGGPGLGFTKGLKPKNCHNFKRKVLTVQELCHKVKTFYG